jgi:hypothetical protein
MAIAAIVFILLTFVLTLVLRTDPGWQLCMPCFSSLHCLREGLTAHRICCALPTDEGKPEYRYVLFFSPSTNSITPFEIELLHLSADSQD